MCIHYICLSYNKSLLRSNEFFKFDICNIILHTKTIVRIEFLQNDWILLTIVWNILKKNKRKKLKSKLIVHCLLNRFITNHKPMKVFLGDDNTHIMLVWWINFKNKPLEVVLIFLNSERNNFPTKKKKSGNTTSNNDSFYVSFHCSAITICTDWVMYW